VPDEFHARFSAHGRSYRYLLINRPVRSALHAGKAGWFHTPLDVVAMQVAAQCLLGEHDFSAFRAAQCQAKSPIKHLRELEIHREGEMLIFDLSAGAFLHHMVRNIVGCLVYVARASIRRTGWRKCWRAASAVRPRRPSRRMAYTCAAYSTRRSGDCRKWITKQYWESCCDAHQDLRHHTRRRCAGSRALRRGCDRAGVLRAQPAPCRHCTGGETGGRAAPFVSVVGLFVNATEAFVREVLAHVPLDLLQFHGDESPKYCAQFGKPYLKAIRVKAGVDLLHARPIFAAPKACCWTLMWKHPGRHRRDFRLDLIPKQLPLPVILSGGLDAENVASAIKQVQPYAVTCRVV